MFFKIGVVIEKIKKRIHHHRCFLANIAKFLRMPILKNICERLLLQLLLLIMMKKLVIKYWAPAGKSIMWNGFC